MVKTRCCAEGVRSRPRPIRWLIRLGRAAQASPRAGPAGPGGCPARTRGEAGRRDGSGGVGRWSGHRHCDDLPTSTWRNSAECGSMIMSPAREEGMPYLSVSEETYRRLTARAAALDVSVDDLIRPALDRLAETGPPAPEPPLPLTGDAWLAE